MGVFCACFVLLFVGPCGLYVSAVLAKRLTSGLRDPAIRRRLPVIVRDWDTGFAAPGEKTPE